MFSKSLEICRKGGPTGNTWVMQKSWSLNHFWACGILPNSIFWAKLKKACFWPFFGSFYPLTSVNGVQMTWSFQRSYFLMRFAWYNFCTCGMPWKKWFFWIFFSIFKSNLPFEDDIKQKSDRKLKLFPADFKYLIGFALVLWENVQTDALFPGC